MKCFMNRHKLEKDSHFRNIYFILKEKKKVIFTLKENKQTFKKGPNNLKITSKPTIYLVKTITTSQSQR